MVSTVRNILGDFRIHKENASAMVIDQNGITFSMYEDLGLRGLDGSESPTSGIESIVYDEYEKPLVHYDTLDTNSIIFEQKILEVNMPLIQKNIEDYIYVQDSCVFTESKSINVKNNAVVPLNNDVIVLGNFKIVITTGRYVEINLGIPEDCIATNLPLGLEIEKGIIKGITYRSGIYRGILSNSALTQEYVIIVPQLQQTVSRI